MRLPLVVSASIAAVFAIAACSSSQGGGSDPAPPEDDITEATPKPKPKDTTPAASATSTETPPPPPPPTDDGGAPGSDAGSTCKDTTPEPGQSELEAYALPAIDDCDGSGGTVRGVANGMFDVDTYKFRGNDTYLCRLDPKATNQTPGVRMCLFAQCLAGKTTVTSCLAGTAATSKTGLPGCCVDGPGDVKLDFDCNGSGDDTADFFLRIDQPKTNECIAYQASYSL
jgi:hypothetical protein